jgi:hypothetical protein
VSGATGTLFRQLREGAPLCLVLYPNLGALDDLIETVRLVAPEHWELSRTADVEDAFHKGNAPLLLTPDNEAAAVRTLDGRREALVDREAPVILFLLKNGSGEQELKMAPGLASWLRESIYDPEPEEIDVEQERAQFEKIAGCSSRQWLEAWRRGEISDTLENSFLYQRALLLEDG